MTRTAIRKKVEAFFKRYAATYARALADKPGVDKAVTRAFADYFVEASPAGVHGGRNGVVFRLMARRGFARYRKIGVESMLIDALEVTPLDDLHAMARLTWDSRTRRTAMAGWCGSGSRTTTSSPCWAAACASSRTWPPTSRRSCAGTA